MNDRKGLDCPKLCVWGAGSHLNPFGNLLTCNYTQTPNCSYNLLNPLDYLLNKKCLFVTAVNIQAQVYIFLINGTLEFYIAS